MVTYKGGRNYILPEDGGTRVDILYDRVRSVLKKIVQSLWTKIYSRVCKSGSESNSYGR